MWRKTNTLILGKFTGILTWTTDIDADIQHRPPVRTGNNQRQGKTERLGRRLTRPDSSILRCVRRPSPTQRKDVLHEVRGEEPERDFILRSSPQDSPYYSRHGTCPRFIPPFYTSDSFRRTPTSSLPAHPWRNQLDGILFPRHYHRSCPFLFD